MFRAKKEVKKAGVKVDIHLLKSSLNLDDINTLRDSIKEDIYRNLKNHYPKGKYPIEYNPKDYTEMKGK